MKTVSINWKGIARFLGMPDMPESELRNLRLPCDGFESVRKDNLKPYITSRQIRPTPHDPNECEFCKTMQEDDMKGVSVK